MAEPVVKVKRELGADVAQTQDNSNKTTRYFERLTIQAGVAPGVARAKHALKTVRSTSWPALLTVLAADLLVVSDIVNADGCLTSV